MTTNRRLGIRTLSAASLLWMACGGAEQPEGEAGADGRGAVQAPADEEALQVFARADSARRAGGAGAEASGAETAGAGREMESPGDAEVEEGVAEPGSQEGLPDSAALEAGPGLLLVPAGTMVRASLDEEVSAERHLAGHAVIATVAADVLAADGRLLVSAGAKLLGRVLVSEPSPGPGEDAHLELEFETLSAAAYERPVHAVLAGGVRTRNPFGGFVQSRPYQGRIRAGTTILVEMRTAFSVPFLADSVSVPGAGASNAG